MRDRREAATAAGDTAALRAMVAPEVQWYAGGRRPDGDGAEMATATMKRRSAEDVLAGAPAAMESTGRSGFALVAFGPGSLIERKACLLMLRGGKIAHVRDQRC